MGLSDFDADDMSDVGSVGILLLGVFLALTAWRTAVTLKEEPLKIMTAIRPMFHVLMLTFAFLEFLYMIGLSAEGDYSKWNYSCHTLALWFNLVAFSTVILLWGKTIALGGSSAWVNRFVLLVNGVNLALTFAVVITLVAAKDANEFFDTDPTAYLLATFVHSVSLFAFSSWMLSYGLRLQWKLTTYPQWEPMDVTRRLEILLKINFVLVLCVLCYTLRVVALAVLLFDIISGSTYTDRTSYLEWFSLSNFVPTLVPGVVLLYVMRTRKEQAPVRFTQMGGAALMQDGQNSPTGLTTELSPNDAIHGTHNFDSPMAGDVEDSRPRQYSDDPYSRYERYSSVTSPTPGFFPAT